MWLMFLPHLHKGNFTTKNVTPCHFVTLRSGCEVKTLKRSKTSLEVSL
jgi:hypothetical protein